MTAKRLGCIRIMIAAWLALTLVASAQKLSVLQVTGQNNHDWEHTSKVMAEFLEATGRFDVTTTTEPTKTLADAAAIAKYRCFLLNYNGERWGDAAETAFLDAVKKGAGVVVVHAANNPFTGWTEYERMIGLCWRDGAGHGKFHPFDVDVIDRNHPVTIDMPPMKAHPDELYHKLTPTPGSEFRVLMTAHSSKESGGTGRDEPMAISLRYGEGRVFHTPLGHVWPGVEDTKVSFANPALRLLIARGTEWAASGRVTIDAASFGVEPLPKVDGRPRDPFVFRCVLDNRARMLVAALHERLWVAYDTTHAAFYAAWPGGMIFDGAVYTGAHGPQPRAIGTPFRRGTERPWHLRRRGDHAEVPDIEIDVRYLGFRTEKGGVTLRWQLTPGLQDVPPIIVEERPEIVSSEPVQFRRSFAVTGLPQEFELFFDVDASGDGKPPRMELSVDGTEVVYIFNLRDTP